MKKNYEEQKEYEAQRAHDYDNARPDPKVYMSRAINELSKLCRHEADRWYRDPFNGQPILLNHGERFALMHSELSEAFEAVRKNMLDDKLPHRRGVEVELADALIRIFDYAGEHGLDLGGALFEKLEYNRKREDHTNASRLSPNGKKY